MKLERCATEGAAAAVRLKWKSQLVKANDIDIDIWLRGYFVATK